MQTEIRLPGQLMQHATSAVLHYHVVEQLPAGHHLVELTTVELHTQVQAAANPLAELLLDIARANSPLLLHVDERGYLVQVVNKTVLAAQWQEILPWLQTKHQRTAGALALLSQVALQYADDNDRLEQALFNKGSCGVLFPGFWGLRPANGDTRTDRKIIHQFFNGGALPLLIEWKVALADTFDQTAEVTGTGRLDAKSFDYAAFQQQIDAMTGPLPRPLALQIAWHERYTVSRTGQGVVAGEQTLRVGIPGVYEQSTRHTVRHVAALTSAFR